MTNEQDEEMNTNLASDEFFEVNKEVYATNPAFKNGVKDFRDNYAEAKKYGAILATNNTVFSQEKLNLKTKMIHDVSEIAGYAYVALIKAGKTMEADQLDINPSDYTLADNESYDLAQANIKLMRDQVAIISPEYVTEIELNNAEASAEAFLNAKGDTILAQKSTPAQREAFILALEKTRTSINHIRILAKKYKKTNPIFYSQLIKVTTVVLTNVHHTSLSLVVKNKDGKPVAGAVCSLSTSKKTVTTDPNGYGIINKIRNGETLVTIQAPGAKDQQQKLHLIKSKENHLEVVVE